MEQKIDLEKERKEILLAFKGLLRAAKNRTRQDTTYIRKAFDVAVEAHKEMRRKSGEPYIYHPIAVARICAWELLLLPVLCCMIPLKIRTSRFRMWKIFLVLKPDE